MLPASGFVDRQSAPHAGGAIEVEEQSGARAAGVLEYKVSIQQNGLYFGQEGIMAV